MRNMSFSKTVEQMRARTKTVTRRYGWWFLKPGDRVQAVEKAIGLKKGEKVKKICVIEIISSHGEKLENITRDECVREGFPSFSPSELIDLIVSMRPRRRHDPYRAPIDEPVNRIEFRYV